MTDRFLNAGSESTADAPQLHHPWMIAVWPGMSHVALNAGIYLLAKLRMSVMAELEPGDLFDVDHVEVDAGLIRAPRHPRNRFFSWQDPQGEHDLIVFLGEAQPPLGKFAFCRQLIDFARRSGVERIFTFAAMATQMRPDERSRVFGAASDQAGVEELKRLEVQILEEGRISGLNGVLLAAAAQVGLRAACLLGEVPHLFAQLPFPKASLAVLEVFATLAGVTVDFAELNEQAKEVEAHLAEFLAKIEQEYREQHPAEAEEEPPAPEPREQPRITATDRARVEQLFEQAATDQRKAFELKRELDQLGVFKLYEDRFLDLFKKRS